MYKKINKNKLGVIEYSIDREEDLDDMEPTLEDLESVMKGVED